MDTDYKSKKELGRQRHLKTAKVKPRSPACEARALYHWAIAAVISSWG